MTQKRNSPRRRKARPLLIASAGLGALLSGCSTGTGHQPFGNLVPPPAQDMAPTDAAPDHGPFGNLIPPPRDLAPPPDATPDHGPFGNLLVPAQDAGQSSDAAVKPGGGR